VHEARLHVHGEQHAEPHEVDPELFRGYRDEGDDDEGKFEEVEEKGEEEDEDVDEDQEARLPPGSDVSSAPPRMCPLRRRR
jgi:hypothetical protein